MTYLFQLNWIISFFYIPLWLVMIFSARLSLKAHRQGSHLAGRPLCRCGSGAAKRTALGHREAGRLAKRGWVRKQPHVMMCFI